MLSTTNLLQSQNVVVFAHNVRYSVLELHRWPCQQLFSEDAVSLGGFPCQLVYLLVIEISLYHSDLPFDFISAHLLEALLGFCALSENLSQILRE